MRGGTPLHTFVIEVERLEEEEMGPPTPKPRNLGTVLLEAKGDEGIWNVLKRNVRASTPMCHDRVAFAKDVGAGCIRNVRDDLLASQ